MLPPAWLRCGSRKGRRKGWPWHRLRRGGSRDGSEAKAEARRQGRRHGHCGRRERFIYNVYQRSPKNKMSREIRPPLLCKTVYYFPCNSTSLSIVVPSFPSPLLVSNLTLCAPLFLPDVCSAIFLFGSRFFTFTLPCILALMRSTFPTVVSLTLANC